MSTTHAQGQSALHHAAVSGHAEGLRALLEAGADSRAVDSMGRTALAAAAALGHAEAVRVLSNGGTEVLSQIS